MSFFLCTFLFLELHVWYVPRLGVQPELQLPAYTTATLMQDPSLLWPTPQLMAMLDPRHTEQGQGANPHPHAYWLDLFP